MITRASIIATLAFCLLVLTEVAAAAAPPSYSYDQQVYGRLVVSVKIDDGTGEDVVLSACPSKGLFQIPIRDILSSDKNYALALSITPNSGGTNAAASAYAPVTVSVKRRTLGADCTITLQNFEYRSPLYYLGDYATTSFTIQRREDQTVKPAAAVAQDAQIVVALALNAAGLPGNLASKIDNPLASIINDFQNTATVSVSHQITFDPQGTTSLPDWSDTVIVGNRQVRVSITSRLETVGSLFDLTSPKIHILVTKNDFASVLTRKILPHTLANMQGQTDAERLVTYAADAESKAVLQASDVAALDTPCIALRGKLKDAGLSDFDSALLTWAVVKSHPKLTGAGIDQISCLKTQESLLNLAGVTLAPPPPNEITHNPSEDEMGEVARDDDYPQDFFKSTKPTDREAAAQAMFAEPVSVSDPDNVLVPNAPSSVRNAQQWFELSGARANTAIFDHFGCYRYVAASDSGLKLSVSTLFAIGEVSSSTGGGMADYIIQLQFAQVGQNHPLLVNRVIVARQADAAILAAIKGNRTSCGDNNTFKPAILFSN